MSKIHSIGFTGSQAGMTKEQLSQLATLLLFLKPSEFHHGDCLGADEQAHQLVKTILPNCQIIIHPPADIKKRAYCGFLVSTEDSKSYTTIDFSIQYMESLPYLQRNHNIVDISEMLIAVPRQRVEILRSGTWATVRYAVKTNKPVELILP